ncbi:ferritin-like domain-containing protein [Thermococcus paralvinellae]|uniref:Rubrerythrin-like protein n=1 Tax=Thermococcus paralvinellae TaxID=582419 RepID=W0I7U5_9EURY|nr:ferritin family protein [Thermococcus paralvinellae]AHF80827.1 rubrerythrin-like protein [Thermococcus paralvinellae]
MGKLTLENLDIEEFIKKLEKLSDKEIISYWIEGELKEAELYKDLAKRAKELELDDRIVETFIILSKESKGHASRLWEIYRRCFKTEKIEKIDLPLIEGEPLLEKFKNAKDVLEVLSIAMESELLAEKIYNILAKRTNDEKIKRIYEYLAAVEREHYHKLRVEYEFYYKKSENCTKY